MLSYQYGLTVYDDYLTLLQVFFASSDNSIAFLFAALASDTLDSVYLMQSTVVGEANVQILAIDSGSATLKADAQLGEANGISTGPLAAGVRAQSINSLQALLTVDGEGQLYGYNRDSGVVQVFGGLNVTTVAPTPLTPDAAGYFLNNFSTDGSPLNTAFSYPSYVAFDALGNRYICDQDSTRVVVQSTDGTYLTTLMGDYTQPQQVRVGADGLVYVSAPY